MRLIDGLSKAQRVVVVVALGLALGVVGTYLVNLGSGIRFGWHAYSPMAATVQAPGTGLPSWLRLIVWLGLIGLWALASIRILRSATDRDAPG
jgi:hypothetical protein